VLEFALRRLEQERVGLLLTVRRKHGSPAATDLTQVLSEERLARLALTPLSLGALHELLRARLGLALARPKLVRLHAATGGNPFHALEIGRELTRLCGDLAAGRPLPLPESLHDLLRVRLTRLPARTRDVLLAAAALAKPTLPLLEAAVGDGQRVAVALEKAARAGVIELDGTRVRFSHPLLASVLYEDAGPPRRRANHRRLAGVVRDPEERARHLALAVDGPDAEVAAALDQAARDASRRGAPAAAAELIELAVELAPPDEEVVNGRRKGDAAVQYSAAGDFGRARNILEQLLAELPPGGERADVLLNLARTRYSDDMEAVVAYCGQALEEAGGDDRRLAEIHRSLSGFLGMLGDIGGALGHARRAVEAAERSGHAASVAATLARLALVETLAGQVTPGILERALELEETNDSVSGYEYQSPTTVLGIRLMLADRVDPARERFGAALTKATVDGDEWRRFQLVLHLTELEWRAGRWEEAERYAFEAHELSEQFGLGRGAGLYVKALLDAYRGRVQDARAAAEQGVVIAQAAGIAPHEIQNLGVLGFLELSLDNPEAADRYLRPLPDRLFSMRVDEPTTYPVWPNAIEALVLTGELEQARAYLVQYEERAERSGSPWARATAARCGALLAAAEGNAHTSFASFERALAEHARMPGPFERGRTLLALGATQRRARKKRAARESLQAALAIFDQLGAPLWAGKARAELALARVSGRPAGSRQLTETERRVAELVVKGRSNKEVAAQLYVTVPTVEGHLSRIYRKLGVRSRTELAHRLAEKSAAKV
jgi:DNA-binding CsgD family transcriptional regulator